MYDNKQKQKTDMDWINKIVEKYGSDNVAKFVLGGYVTALSAALGLYGLVGAVLAVGWAAYDSKKENDEVVKEDVLPVAYGSLASVVAFLLF